MRFLLAILLSVVFLHTQVYAINGGPDYSQGTSNSGIGTQSFTGTYAGVFVPDVETEDNPNTVNIDESSLDSVGLFSLGAQDAGLAQGGALVFVAGAAFTGSMVGIVDPGTSKVTAVIDATSTYQVRRQTGTDDQGFPIYSYSAIFASGSLEAEIGTSGFSSVGARLEGSADVAVFGRVSFDGTPIVSSTAKYIVDGFKQSETVAVDSITFRGL